MTDLISRQAALKVVCDTCQFVSCPDDDKCDEYEAMKNLPSAEPERINGHWIDAVIPNDSGGLPVIVCDKCNTFFPLQFGDGHNFCPYCGADMRGEKK